MKVIKTKKVSEAVEKFGEDPFKKMPEMEEKTRGQIPYAGAEAIKDAKKHSEEVDKMSKDQVKAAEKDGALKNTEKDRTEPIKVKTSELKKMHLSEKLREDVEEETVETSEFDIEDLSEKYNPVAVEFADNGDGYFSVKLEDKDVEFTTWVDVIVKDDDVTTEWNNYIFYMTDPTERFKKEMQDNADVFDKADAAAVNYLIDQNVIAQRDDASWYVVGKQEESVKKLHEAREVFNDPIDNEVEDAVHKIIGEDVIGNAKDGYYLMDEDECEYAREALDKQFGAKLKLDFEKVNENDPNFEDFKWLMRVFKANNRDGVADDLYADVMDNLTRGASVYHIKRPKALKKDESGDSIVGYTYYDEVSARNEKGNTIISVIAPDEKGLDLAIKTANYYDLDYNVIHLDKPIKGDAESRFPYYNYRCDIIIPKFAISTVSIDDSEDND